MEPPWFGFQAMFRFTPKTAGCNAEAALSRADLPDSCDFMLLHVILMLVLG
jgi:hypothetical protein